MDILNELNDLFGNLAISFAQPSEAQYALTDGKLQALYERLETVFSNGSSEQSLVQDVVNQAQHMRNVAAAFQRANNDLAHIDTKFGLDIRAVLSSPPRTAHTQPETPASVLDCSPSPQLPPTTTPDEYRPWRLWFLKNFTRPFPRGHFDELLEAMPQKTVAQCTTYFVNLRKRSGWAKLYKEYGGSSERGMRALVASMEDLSSLANPESLAQYRKVRAFIEPKDLKVELNLAEIKQVAEEKAAMLASMPPVAMRGKRKTSGTPPPPYVHQSTTVTFTSPLPPSYALSQFQSPITLELPETFSCSTLSPESSPCTSLVSSPAPYLDFLSSPVDLPLTITPPTDITTTEIAALLNTTEEVAPLPLLGNDDPFLFSEVFPSIGTLDYTNFGSEDEPLARFEDL